MTASTDTATRIPPLRPEEFSSEQAALVGDWKHLNFCQVLVRHPGQYGKFVPWLAALVAETNVSPRDREIICLYMLELCGETYEKSHHVVIARKSGLTDEEIAAILAGGGDCLDEHDHDVLRATEELYRDQKVSDATWARLGTAYSQQQLMEIVFLGGCYATMAMLTKSFEIPLEPELESFNALRSYA